MAARTGGPSLPSPSLWMGRPDGLMEDAGVSQ